jgi:alpha-galactosidase
MTGQSQSFKDQAHTPPIGWDSWNWFQKRNLSEEVIRGVIDAIASEGIGDAGDEYVADTNNENAALFELGPNSCKFLSVK